MTSRLKTHSLQCFLALLFSMLGTFIVFGTELPPKTTWEEMWSIRLINDDNLMEGEEYFDSVSFNGQKVDARAGAFYQEMLEAAQKDGINLYLRSGYRSISTQTYLVQQAIQRYMGYGYTYSTAVSIAGRYYAAPGGSEHNIGLAFDIITPEYHQSIYTLDSRFAQTAAYGWLMEHCATYGFILRYPEEKTDITGISFEPWHYRYVGQAHAEYIMENALVLEEYVALYQKTYPELYGDEPPVEEEVEEEDTFFSWKKINTVYNGLQSVFPFLLTETEPFQEESVQEEGKTFLPQFLSGLNLIRGLIR